MENEVRFVTATELRAHCSALLKEVREHRVEIIVTKRGKPVAKLVPKESHGRPSLAFILAGPLGDIVSPIDEEWEAMSDNSEWAWWEEPTPGPLTTPSALR